MLEFFPSLRASLFSGLLTGHFLRKELSLHFAFDELVKFESVLFSKLAVYCDELSPQDHTPVVCLIRLTFHLYFLVDRLLF